jgi:hypothetical protein
MRDLACRLAIVCNLLLHCWNEVGDAAQDTDDTEGDVEWLNPSQAFLLAVANELSRSHHDYFRKLGTCLAPPK